MKKFSPVSRFLVGFVIIYGLMMAPWPGLNKAYSSFFNKMGDTLFSNFGSKGVIRFTMLDTQGDEILINMGKRGGGSQISLYDAQTLKPRYVSYMHFALLLALILASPVVLKRKAWALGGGIVLFHLFLVFKMLIVIVSRYNFDKPFRIYHFNEFWTLVVNTAVDMFVIAIGPSLMVVALIWLLATFRKADWEGLPKLFGAINPTPRA